MKMTGTKFTVALMTFCIIVGMTLLSIPSLVYAQNIPVTLEQDYQTFTGDVYSAEVYGLTEQELRDLRVRSFPPRRLPVDVELTVDGKTSSQSRLINHGQISLTREYYIIHHGEFYGGIINFEPNPIGYYKDKLVDRDDSRSFIGKCGLTKSQYNPQGGCHYTIPGRTESFISFRGRSTCADGIDSVNCYSTNLKPIGNNGTFTTIDGKIELKVIFDEYYDF